MIERRPPLSFARRGSREARGEEEVKKLNTPSKIQDFLDKIPFNFEKNGETYMSPIKMMTENKAHCFEGINLRKTLS